MPGSPSDVTTALELAKLGAELGAEITRVVLAAVGAGRTSTVEALRPLLESPEAQAALDEALRLAQARQAEARLPPGRGGTGR